ncbi:hypothetical protein LNA76_05885 [Alcaligenes sp. MMA]|uniref:putative metallopeptidase n=1 Tax=Alcaligenes sp. MMA TaxID=2893019 RepID=UPI001E2AFB83|nr:putative metallopeptidase [Alcaligenes sp. MMA]MCC9162855.1 hypothetical protein [Alcaligenes sp. MMA]
MTAQDKAAAKSKGGRPYPPDDIQEDVYLTIRPAYELEEWVNQTILSSDGALYNPDHAHLLDASIRFLWASESFNKQGRRVLGQAEEVAFRSGGWQKARQEQQMREWFDYVPEFVITLAADYCSQCTDAEFCALVEHELYHIGHSQDEFGSPKFIKEGLPKLAIRGHDVEEFIGVVRRYGASADVARMVDTAKQAPEVEGINISRACGTCLLRAA